MDIFLEPAKDVYGNQDDLAQWRRQDGIVKRFTQLVWESSIHMLLLLVACDTVKVMHSMLVDINQDFT